MIIQNIGRRKSPEKTIADYHLYGALLSLPRYKIGLVYDDNYYTYSNDDANEIKFL